MVKPSLDLKQLSLDRSPQKAMPANDPHRKRWITRYVLPLCILIGFIALFGIAAGRGLTTSRTVTVVPVVVKRAEAQPAGTPMFQSPGWIEPRPTSVRVAALAPGVIEELMVVEGQQVRKGEPIAQLISIDAELVVEQAKNSVAIRQGQLQQAIAGLNAAKVRFANPVHLQVQLADAISTQAKAKTELAKLPFLIEAATATANYALTNLQQKEAAQAAISRNILARAESEYAAASATLQELRQRQPNLQRELNALDDKVEAIRRQLELLVEETRQEQEAEAAVQSAKALRAEAQLRLQQAELLLERNIIRAPMDGRVLRLIAAPGTRVSGLESNDGQDSGTVVEMYDPGRLQVRADVRLEDVPMVTRGQLVEIETASSPHVIKGRVLQTTSAASVQKNTLEVKVELIDPPETVSPDMLATATFLAPVVDSPTNATTETEHLFVPQQLVAQGDTGAFVWVVGADNTARKQFVEVGGKRGEGLVMITSGLNPTDKLIASDTEELSDGSRVNVAGDDQIIGMN